MKSTFFLQTFCFSFLSKPQLRLFQSISHKLLQLELPSPKIQISHSHIMLARADRDGAWCSRLVDLAAGMFHPGVVSKLCLFLLLLLAHTQLKTFNLAAPFHSIVNNHTRSATKFCSSKLFAIFNSCAISSLKIQISSRALQNLPSTRVIKPGYIHAHKHAHAHVFCFSPVLSWHSTDCWKRKPGCALRPLSTLIVSLWLSRVSFPSFSLRHTLTSVSYATA